MLLLLCYQSFDLMICGEAALGMPLSLVDRNFMCFPCATSCPVLVLFRSTLMVAIKPPTFTTYTHPHRLHEASQAYPDQTRALLLASCHS